MRAEQSECDLRHDPIGCRPYRTVGAVDEASGLQRGHIGMHATILPTQRPGEGRNRHFRLAVEVTEQAVALPGHDMGQTVPGFKRQHPFRGRVAPFGSVPSPEERDGVVAERSADRDFQIVHLAALIPVMSRVVLHIGQVVLDQLPRRREGVGFFERAVVPVVSLAGFVIVANKPLSVPTVVIAETLKKIQVA